VGLLYVPLTFLLGMVILGMQTELGKQTYVFGTHIRLGTHATTLFGMHSTFCVGAQTSISGAQEVAPGVQETGKHIFGSSGVALRILYTSRLLEYLFTLE
jgi:hypothetical protein